MRSGTFFLAPTPYPEHRYHHNTKLYGDIYPIIATLPLGPSHSCYLKQATILAALAPFISGYPKVYSHSRSMHHITRLYGALALSLNADCGVPDIYAEAESALRFDGRGIRQQKLP